MDSPVSRHPVSSESHQPLAVEHALQVDEGALHLGEGKSSRTIPAMLENASHPSSDQEGDTPKPVPALEEARLVDDVLVRAGAAIGHRLVLTQQTDREAAVGHLLAQGRREVASGDVRGGELVHRQAAVLFDESPYDFPVGALVVHEEYARGGGLGRIQGLDALKEPAAEVGQDELARRGLRRLDLGQAESEVRAELDLQAR